MSVTPELLKQVEIDWSTLPSNKVRAKRAENPDYEEALTQFLNSDPVVQDLTDVPATGASIEDELLNTPTPEPEAEPVAPSAAPAPVVTTPEPVAAPVAEEGDPYKTADGWEVKIDLEDGGGVQVFKARTQRELISKLADAQKNATRKIRYEAQQKKERQKRRSTAEPEKVQTRTAAAPKTLSADELWSLGQGITDPTKFDKSIVAVVEARLGRTLESLIVDANKLRDVEEENRARNVSSAWVANNPEFYNTADNRTKLLEFFQERPDWAITEKNLDIAFSFLNADDLLVERPEEVEVEPVVTPTPVAIAPATVPTTQPQVAAPAPAGLPEGVRLRPGSASTGMSPRNASVRHGAAAASPVGLTAEDYRKIPASETKTRYRTDPSFKASVDKLISEGKI